MSTPSKKQRYSIQIVLSQQLNDNDSYQDLGKLLVVTSSSATCSDFVIAAKKSIDAKYGKQYKFNYDLKLDEDQNGLQLFIGQKTDNIKHIKQTFSQIVDFTLSINDFIVDLMNEVIVFLFTLKPDSNNNNDDDDDDVLPTLEDEIGDISPTIIRCFNNGQIKEIQQEFTKDITVCNAKKQIANIFKTELKSQYTLKPNIIDSNKCICWKIPHLKQTQSVHFYFQKKNDNQIHHIEYKQHINFNKSTLSDLCKIFSSMVHGLKFEDKRLFANKKNVTFKKNVCLKNIGFKNGAINIFHICGCKKHPHSLRLKVDHIKFIQKQKPISYETHEFESISSNLTIYEIKKKIEAAMGINKEEQILYYLMKHNENENTQYQLIENNSTEIAEIGELRENLHLFVESHSNSMNCTFDLFCYSGYFISNTVNNNKLYDIFNNQSSDDDNILYVSPRWLSHKNAFIKESISSSKIYYESSTLTISDTLRLSASWIPFVVQTRKGMTAFLSCLYIITMKQNCSSLQDKILGFIRYLTMNKFSPFLLSLKILLNRRCLQITKQHKAVITNGFYHLFREFIPKKICNDNSKVFQYSHIIFSFILGRCNDDKYKRFEKYTTKQLTDPITLNRLNDPVTITNNNNNNNSNNNDDGKKELIYSRQTIERKQEFKHLTKTDIISNQETCLLLQAYTKSNEVYIWNYKDLPSIDYKDDDDGDHNMKNNYNDDDDDDDDDDNDNSLSSPILSRLKLTWNDVTNSIGNNRENKMMKIVPTLSIKNLSSKCIVLTLDCNGDLCALCGAVKDDKNTRQFYLPLYRDLYVSDIDTLALKIKNLNLSINAETGWIDDGNVIDDRQPLEAIVVCLDRSLSMEDSFFGSDMNRLDIVKIYFDAFLNRSKAYDYANHMGLILFGSKIQTTCSISPLYEKFREKINDIEVEGRTALKDAMKKAAEQLNHWKSQYSNRKDCNLRIITLTDGVDNRSITKDADLTELLLKSGITADSIMIGKYNRELHRICYSTGGYVFFPKSLRDGLRIFELETFLSITERGDLNERKSMNRNSVIYDLTNYYETNVDLCDENNVPKGKIIDNLKRENPTISLRSTINKIEQSVEIKSRYNAKLRTRTVLRGMKDIMKNAHNNYDIYIDENNIFFWKLICVAPLESLYHGGIYELYMKFPDNYPDKAPKMRFITPIKHVNVNSYGRICHSIFDRNYNPDTKIRDILNSVYALMMYPDYDDPLDSVLRQEFADNEELFRVSVANHVAKYAMTKTRDQWERELSGQNQQNHEYKNDDDDHDDDDDDYCQIIPNLEPIHHGKNNRKRSYVAMNDNNIENDNVSKKRRLT